VAISVVFVCLGNICRSPTAEGVFRKLVRDAGLEAAFRIDSAGTGEWHVGDQPDPRTAAAARRRGIHLDHAARLFRAHELSDWDYVLAMDRSNHRNLIAMARGDETMRRRIHLLRDFDADGRAGAEVPDPYYGGPSGFEEVLDICEAACRGLLDRLVASHALERRR